MQIKPHTKCRSYRSYAMAEESAEQFFKKLGDTVYQRVSWAIVPVDINAVGLERYRWTVVVFVPSDDVYPIRQIAECGWKVTN